MRDEEYDEAVLRVVELVPRGRATTYGLIAEALFEVLARGGPRQVAAVMAKEGAGVTWWRVVRADGSLPAWLADEARQGYLEEGTPLRPSGAVDLASCVWTPPDIHSLDLRPVDNWPLPVDSAGRSVDDTPTSENSPK